jgi:hypothetical protein
MDFEALERLGRLRSSGAISDEEFESEKHRLLGGEADKEPQTSAVRDLPQEPADDWESASQKGPTTRKSLLALAALVLVAILTVVVLAGTGFVTISKSPTSSGEAAPAARYALRSTVSGVHIAPTTELPQNPHGDDPSCNSYEKTPIGSAAKLVRSKGWHVISENPVGKLDAVYFVGACAPLSDGAFSPIDPNVGMFEGDALMAVVYGKRLGFVESAEDSMELRITNKTKEVTVGRIAVTDSRITVRK